MVACSLVGGYQSFVGIYQLQLLTKHGDDTFHETVKARVCTLSSPCGVCGEQSGNGAEFSLSTLLSRVSIIPLLFCIHSCIKWG
jgi:hypothetical protein